MSQATPLVPPYGGASPLTLGQILDRIFTLFRTNLALFLKIAGLMAAAYFVAYVPVGIALFVSGVFTLPPHPPDLMKLVSLALPLGLLGSLLVLAAYSLFEAASSYAALQANLGIKVSFNEAYRVAWHKAGRFIWLMILRSLWVGLPIWACYAVMGGASLLVYRWGGNTHPAAYFLLFPALVLLSLGAFAYALFMTLCLALAPSACVAEDLRAAGALRRSLALARNAKGRIFVVLLVVYAAGYIAFMIFEALCFALGAGGALLSVALHIHLAAPWSYIAIALLSVCLLSVILLWLAAISASYSIAFAVIYHDQRLRIDGFSPVGLAAEPPL